MAYSTATKEMLAKLGQNCVHCGRKHIIRKKR